MPGQLDFSYGYLFCRMPQLCGHRPERPSTPGPCPGGQPLDSQSPLVVCRHQLSTAAWAKTMFWSMPHLQAAQRKISWVVPVKLPLIRGPIHLPACGTSPEKKLLPTDCPVVWLKRLFTPLFSGNGRARTHFAHWPPVGSLVPGGRVWKYAGAEVASALDRAAAAVLAALSSEPVRASSPTVPIVNRRGRMNPHVYRAKPAGATNSAEWTCLGCWQAGSCTPAFAEPWVGFVQSPQDYRGWR